MKRPSEHLKEEYAKMISVFEKVIEAGYDAPPEVREPLMEASSRAKADYKLTLHESVVTILEYLEGDNWPDEDNEPHPSARWN